MDEQNVKKRGWVKNAAIIFLSIMLVLTLFSNTIMNRSLPEVATASVESGSINAKIRGTGKVTAGDSYEVNLEDTRTIEAVYVKVGDTVAVGDVLFLLADQDSSELSQAQEQLSAARRSYQSALIDMSSADYTKENRNIKRLREALSDAQAKLDAGAVTAEEVNMAAANLKEAKRAQAALEKALSEGETTLSEAQATLKELQAQVKSLEESIDKQEKTLSTLEDELYRLKRGQTYTSSDLTAAQRELAAAQRNYADYWSKNQTALDSLRTKAEGILGKGASEDEIIRQMEALSDAYLDSNLSDAYKATSEEHTAFLGLKNGNSGKYVAMKNAEDKVAAVQAGLNNNASIQEQISAKQQEIDAAEDALSDSKSELRQAKKQLAYQEDTVSAADSEYTALKERKDAQDEQVTAFQETYDDLYQRSQNYDGLKSAVDSAETALEDALFNLAEQKKNDNKQSAKDQITLQGQREEIAKLEKEVEKWKSKSVDAKITAKTAGLVTAVNAVAGREVAAGTALATIDVVDRGYSVRIAVTNEQSQKVRIGDPADVTNYYWGKEISAVLTQIVNDPQNPGKGKYLVFTVTGDVSSGESLTLSVGQKSANYDAIVPTSAVRSDTNGSFVLVITAKNTPLGNRYTATRADVTVLAQDDTKTAVSGLAYGDFVITTSSKPLEAGMQVKMVENG